MAKSKKLVTLIREIVRAEVKKEVIELCSKFPIYNYLNRN